jgi:hypothetical protein
MSHVPPVVIDNTPLDAAQVVHLRTAFLKYFSELRASGNTDSPVEELESLATLLAPGYCAEDTFQHFAAYALPQPAPSHSLVLFKKDDLKAVLSRHFLSQGREEEVWRRIERDLQITFNELLDLDHERVVFSIVTTPEEALRAAEIRINVFYVLHPEFTFEGYTNRVFHYQYARRGHINVFMGVDIPLMYDASTDGFKFI